MKKKRRIGKADQYLLIFVLCCAVIALTPLFVFEYYEFLYPLIRTVKTGIVPVLVLAVVSSLLFYFRLQEPEMAKKMTGWKRFVRITLLSVVTGTGLLLVCANGAIVLNAFVGQQKSIRIDTPAAEVYLTTSRGGMRYHRIRFKHPSENRMVEIGVGRKYFEAERIQKRMGVGSFGFLYTFKSSQQ